MWTLKRQFFVLSLCGMNYGVNVPALIEWRARWGRLRRQCPSLAAQINQFAAEPICLCTLPRLDLLCPPSCALWWANEIIDAANLAADHASFDYFHIYWRGFSLFCFPLIKHPLDSGIPGTLAHLFYSFLKTYNFCGDLASSLVALFWEAYCTRLNKLVSD